MAEPIGLRERNKLERRSRLVDVAIDLFERDGFDKTTIEQIAASAGLAPRTFFSYFATKDDLVLADYADRLHRILAELDHRPAEEPPWAALQAAFAAVASDYETQAERLRRRFTITAANPSIFARSLELQAGWEQALAVMRASLQHWLTTRRPPALPALVQSGFDQLASGLGTH